MTDPVRVYIGDIQQTLQQGIATEGSHYHALKGLLEAFVPGVNATILPKHITEVGRPDFSVAHGAAPIGYVEAKDVGNSLDPIEKGKGPDGERFKNYLALPNLILTNYVEFRWYVYGERRLVACLGTVDAKAKIKRDAAGMKAASDLLNQFLTTDVQTVTPQELAERMAGLARMIRSLIGETFMKEGEKGRLHSQLAAFREVLVPDLDASTFADMYAQTITYGLFAASCNHPGPGFSRQGAAYDLPKTNPFLRNLFTEIAGPSLDERIAWAVDDVADLLRRTDMAAVLEGFGKQTAQKDPVFHFYETFLAAYDPSIRESRGVYYTPEEVVSYIVRSVDHVLRLTFGRIEGLANNNTLVLDPACGTGTFLYSTVEVIRSHLAGQEGAWSPYVAAHLLPRLFGFELLMAPYAVAHLKLGLQLADSGYDFGSEERLGVYLTNALEQEAKKSEQLFASWISDEAEAATSIKRERPIMVVFGNPPYQGHSANRSEIVKEVPRTRKVKGKEVPVTTEATGTVKKRMKTFIGQLIEDYKLVDGAPLGEKNPKWLQDDYVKFLRFGQWRINRTGQGILAFITNHGYLDNPTFRGMRQQLMEAFTDIYILDLHGNQRKKEQCPDGSPDKNVFDIQQGVAIGIFVKDPKQSVPATVHHAERWGLQEEKYAWLDEQDISTTKWAALTPCSPHYLFTPQDTTFLAEYEKGWELTKVMPVNSVGIVTGRDRLVFDFDESTLRGRIADFLNPAHSDDTVRGKYLRPKDNLSVSDARKVIEGDSEWQQRFLPCLYRPFDPRALFYHDAVVERSRRQVMRHMLAGENLALITSRLTKGETFKHAQVTRHIAEVICMSPNTSNNGFVFPLYIYPATHGASTAQTEIPGLSPWPQGKGGRWPNLSAEFAADLQQKLGLTLVPEGTGDLVTTLGPEDVLHYIYAILHSPTYRNRYAGFLKTDFPRLPLTSNRELFAVLVKKGKELVALHLMQSPALGTPITTYPATGTNAVEKVLYNDKCQRVYINGNQYFEGVAPDVWAFQVGGYQVCERWLRYRKSRQLSYDDIAHYQKIVVALSETMRVMGEIDAAIPSWPLK